MLYLGVQKAKQAGFDESELKRIIVTNLTAGLCGSVTFIFFWVHLYYGNYLQLFGCVLPAVGYPIVLLLNYNGHVVASRVLVIMISNLAILVGIVMSNGSLEMGQLFITAALATVVMFSVSHKKIVFMCMFMSFACSIIASLLPPMIDLPEPLAKSTVRILNSLLNPVGVIAACAPAFALLSVSEKYFQGLREAKQGEMQQSRMAALGVMSAGMAHEINNPLTVIAARSEALTEFLENSGDMVPKDKLLKPLAAINRNVERVHAIIKSLKTYARSSDKDPMIPIALRQIVDGSVELCQQRMKSHGIDLQVRVGADIMICANETEILQVLVNLLHNAVDAIEDVDPPRADAKVELFTTVGPQQVEIHVKDNGTGIPYEIFFQIMEPFFTTKAVGKGTGLGLSISKGIVEKHHGVLTATSLPGETIFTIRLPLLDHSSQVHVGAEAQALSS